jgi:Glycosyl hydrolase family 65 central catalytic domain/Glycosyl hydrolase family 65, C-terminal domain
VKAGRERSITSDTRQGAADGPPRLLDSGVDAIVVDWDAIRRPGGRVEPEELGPRLESLSHAGVDVMVMSIHDITELDGLVGARPAGPGRLFLCAGDEPDLFVVDDQGREPVDRRQVPPVTWLIGDLRDRGIGEQLVLFIGDGSVESGQFRALRVRADRESLLRYLDEQLARRAEHRLPAIDEDPAWILALGDDPVHGRALDALLSLGDGCFGARGEGDGGATSSPMVLAAGVYSTSHDSPQLLPGPLWNRLELEGARPDQSDGRRRVLDLRTGVVTNAEPCAGGVVRSLWFNALGRPGFMAMRAEGPLGAIEPGAPIRPPPPMDGVTCTGQVRADRAWYAVTAATGAGITVAASQRRMPSASNGALESFERLAVYVADPCRTPSTDIALDLLHRAEEDGFDRALAEHRRDWAARWSDAEVSIDGDPETELAVRFAIFHLLASVADTGEAAVGARGLSGPAYGGHVFWDADVFVLPAVAAMHPRAARAMLEYRIRRLDAARQLAAERGFDGARFPWESARDGDDVTPRLYKDTGGTVTPIHTGACEEHIVADVAWAAWHYSQWSGDDEFLIGAGRPLLTETARYWASRVHRDESGRAHILGVIGPDEYHEHVDDNAFTNVMARWNLRTAADVIDPHRADRSGPAREWRVIADELVDGMETSTGRYEQFAGFDDLEPLLITESADPPVAADILLGWDRVRQAQVVKQADVLMLHHLVPEEVAPGSLGVNLDFYLPRTAHGSSLSPAIHASLLARADRADAGRDLLRLACRLDLDDLTGMTGGGLHLATMGGVWQAIGFGFAGLRASDGVLHLDPRLPVKWKRLGLNLRFRGRRLRLGLRPDEVEVTADGPVRVCLPGMAPEEVTASGGRFVHRSGQWTRRTT